MFAPMSEEHLKINKMYCVNSVISIILYITARCNPKLDLLAMVAFILTMLRLIVRNLDYENSFELNKRIWIETVVANNISLMFDLVMLITHFKYRKLRNIAAFFMILGFFFSDYFIFRQVVPSYSIVSYLINWGLFCVVWIYLLCYQQAFQKEVHNQLFKQKQTQKHMHAIVENLEESLLTVNGQCIEFLNQKFIKMFAQVMIPDDEQCATIMASMFHNIMGFNEEKSKKEGWCRKIINFFKGKRTDFCASSQESKKILDPKVFELHR